MMSEGIQVYHHVDRIRISAVDTLSFISHIGGGRLERLPWLGSMHA
jgi:hypothetical protein